MSESPNYCWIVPCKNDLLHQQREYLYFRHPYLTHRIPLAPTDALAPLPTLNDQFSVQRDECGETYTYTHALKYAGPSRNFLSPLRRIHSSNECSHPTLEIRSGLAWAPPLSIESREAPRCAMCRTVSPGNWCILSSLGRFDRNDLS